VRVVCLAGGVGGAKLVWGLAQLLPAEHLTIIGNTGDDFQQLGLTICPDLDTVMYTLAGLTNPATGWGVADESFQAMEMLARYGRPDWFQLGDRDLGTHIARTELLAAGQSLTAVTAHLCRSLGIQVALLPMSDAPAPTMMDTDEGLLPFQEWFVHRAWRPAVRQVLLPKPAPAATQAVIDALRSADFVIIAPSNPLVSVEPILHVRPVRDLLRQLPVVAVSPIIGGQAVKGPAAKMMAELDMEVSPLGVARYYHDLLTGFVLDQVDIDLLPQLKVPALATATWMRSDADRIQLAQTVLDWSATLL